jgi:hypothetical protein
LVHKKSTIKYGALHDPNPWILSSDLFSYIGILFVITYGYSFIILLLVIGYNLANILLISLLLTLLFL